MPLIRIDIRKGNSPEDIKKLCDAVHDAVLTAFKVPVRDRYQIVYEHAGHTLIVEDTGLGIPRSNKLVVVSVTSRPRNEEAKLTFYRVLCEKLDKHCGISAADIVVNISTNTDADWSFGYGRAQFLTGEL